MFRNVKAALPVIAAAMLVLLPALASAQTGIIAGQARDGSGGALPGVLVEVTSPALIEKVRSATTDGSGRYVITALPAGTYKVTFTLAGFNVSSRENVQVTTDFTANVTSEMKVGDVKEVINVQAETPTVDVTSPAERTVFTGEELRDLPTQRNARDLASLVPGMYQSNGFFSSSPPVCSGGSGNGSGANAFCTPILLGFNSHTQGSSDFDGVNQGRLQVDGMTVGANGGGTSSYIADVANAQEVTFNLSGGLGDNETGGAIINIVPRTGGNRYAGNFFTSYTRNGWADRNTETRNNLNTASTIDQDHDVSGGFGGPIVKDRFWFYAVARHQGRDTVIPGAFRNVNESVYGAHYVPADGLSGRPLLDVPGRDDIYKNANVRLTVQASPRNKFNIFWDEQDVCFSPCKGIQTNVFSPEAVTSLRTWPNHVAQLSWTNPLTGRVLLDAGFSALQQHVDQTRHFAQQNYPDIPRITETTAGSLAYSVNGITSGSQTGAVSNIDNFQSRASASYITGTHNAKVGYQGAYLSSSTLTKDNNPRLAYNYNNQFAPGGNPALCVDPTFPCGNNTIFRPNDPFNTSLSTVPSSFTISVGDRSTDEVVWFGAFYVQDQWTVNRFTFNGALRYEHVESRYNKTCVGPDLYVPVGYCLNDPADPFYQSAVASAPAGRSPTAAGEGVKFNDITPRFGLAWDMFGTGKTALKWNMGKYLGAAGVSGIYTASNPAGASRSTNTLTRNWNDDDGDRRVDCDLMNFSAQDNRATGGDRCAAPFSGATQFGVSPYSLDQSGAPLGLATTQCGRTEPGIPASVFAYCEAADQNLLDGWNKRRYEWQFGIGIQHEVLPRLSAEITYNRRWYGNQQVTDNVGQGCDLYGATSQASPETCMAGAFDYQYPGYDFYSLNAPVDGRLPGGGGYPITGFGTPATATPFPNTNAVTYSSERRQVWRGVDTNFIYRAPGGLRFSGGTSTGAEYDDTCGLMVNTPNVKTREDGDPNCRIEREFQTNVRATATYTIPKVDVLVSTVFQYRPGVEIQANYTYGPSSVQWENPARNGTNFFQQNFPNSATSRTDNLLNVGDMYGEGLRTTDLKVAKNIRFGPRRLTVGADIYNLFNSDAILGYNTTYNPTAAGGNPWLRPTELMSPRFVRFSVNFDF